MSENAHDDKARRAPASEGPTTSATTQPTAGGGGVGGVLQLQRSAGNAATAQLIQRTLGASAAGTIQRAGTATKTSETTKEHTAYGTTTTTETKNRLGKGSSSDDSTDVFDGTTSKTTSVKGETFAGAETAVKRISSATDTEIKEAVEAMARAGVFGESSRSAAIERGALRAKAEGSAKGMAGAEASFKGSVTVSPDLFHALVAVMEAAAMAGVSGDLKGALEVGLGPLALGITAQLQGMAGAMAAVKAKLDVGITHLYAEAEAEVFAGARGQANVDVTLKLGDAEATAGIEGKASAGAGASAGGTFKMDLTGVEIGGKVEAFAGVKADATAKGEFKYKGRTIVKASGTVGVSAGVGGKAEAQFGFRGGKLHIKGDLAGTLGIGGEVAGELEIDFYELALMIEEVIVEHFLKKKEAINRSSPDVERAVIIDEALAAQTRQKGYDTYIKDFMAYNAKKAKQGESGVKAERVQEILDKRWHANKDNWQFVEFDEGIVNAAKDAFGSKLMDVIIQGGQIRLFNVKRTDEQKAHIAKEGAKKAKKGWF